MVPLRELLARIDSRSNHDSEFVPIHDSIHLKACESGSFEDYDIYTRYQPEHNVDNFKHLINNFDITKIMKIHIAYHDILQRYYIVDGLHRVSICIKKGIEFLPVHFFNISIHNIEKTSNILHKTTETQMANGWNNKRCKYGYHSFIWGNIKLVGQRNPIVRLNVIRMAVDLTCQRVLDVGCNTGGMLLNAYEIDSGLGIDVDASCVRAANYLAPIVLMQHKLSFVCRDLENGLQTKFKPTLIFLLSMGSWLSNWKQIFRECDNTRACIILETNNDEEGKYQLDFFTSIGRQVCEITHGVTDDTTGNNKRRLYKISVKL